MTFCFAAVNFKESTIMVKKFQYLSMKIFAVLITASGIRYRENFRLCLCERLKYSENSTISTCFLLVLPFLM